MKFSMVSTVSGTLTKFSILSGLTNEASLESTGFMQYCLILLNSSSFIFPVIINTLAYLTKISSFLVRI